MAPFRLFSMAAAPAIDTTPAHAMLSNSRHQPADLSHHLNRATRARTPSTLKGLYRYIILPGMINLAGGMPFAGYFPFDTLEAAVCSFGRFPTKLVKQLNTPVPIMSASPPLALLRPRPRPRSRLLSFFKSPALTDSPTEGAFATHFEIPKFSPVGNRGSRMDVATALQYCRSSGFPPLAEFVKDFALNHMHGGKIPYANPGVLLTCGSTDGFGKVVEMLAERGDNMLVEEYTYPNAVETALPYGVGMAPVKIDHEGLIPEALRDVLEGWDVQRRGRRPKFLYTITVGQNPTGGLLSLKRKEEIYAICDRFDVLIIEDDPYWYLQYTDGATTPDSPTSSSRYPFLDSLIPSFLTLDTTGRVLRLDTFSKSIAPGCRLGFITAQQPFIERLSRIVETTTQAPSGFSQMMVIQLLQGVWGMDGWVTWLEGLRGAYEARMRAMCAVLEANTHTTVSRDLDGDGDDDEQAAIIDKREMYSFHTPEAGMFVWVHIHITSHPAYSSYLSRDPKHTKREMMTKLWGYTAERHSCLSCPGWVFAPDQVSLEDGAAERLRLCFAAIEEGTVVDASERFCKGVREFWEMTAEEIERCCKSPEL